MSLSVLYHETIFAKLTLKQLGINYIKGSILKEKWSIIYHLDLKISIEQVNS